MSRHHPHPTVVDPRGEPEVTYGGIAFSYPTMEAARAAVAAMPRVLREPRGEGR